MAEELKDPVEWHEKNAVHCSKCDADLGWGSWYPRFEGKVYCEECMMGILCEMGKPYIRKHIPNFCSGSPEDIELWNGVEDLVKRTDLKDGWYLGYSLDENYGACIMLYTLVPNTDIFDEWYVLYNNITDMTVMCDLCDSDLRQIFKSDYNKGISADPVIAFMNDIKDDRFKLDLAEQMIKNFKGEKSE